MTRFLVPADYGVLAMVQAVSSIAEVVFTVGASSAFARFYPEYRNSPQAAVAVRTFNLQLLAQSLIGGILLFTTLPYGYPLLFGAAAPPFWPYGLAGVLLSFLYLTTSIPLLKARMDKNPKQYLFLRLFSFVLSSAAIIYFVIIKEQKAWGSLKGQLLGALVTAIVTLWIFRRTLFKRDASTNVFDTPLVKRSWRYGFPLFLNDVVGWIFSISDRVLIQRFRTTSVLGIYQMANNFALPMEFAINAINFAWMPTFFNEAIEKKNHKGITHNSLRIYSGVLLLLMGYTVILKPMITLMTHDQFHISYKITSILMIYYATRIAYCLATHILAVQDKTKLLAANTFVTSISQLLLNLALIPSGGAIAAATATAIAGVIRLIHITTLIKKHWPIALPLRAFSMVSLFFLAGWGIIFWLDQLISTPWNAMILVTKVATVGLFWWYLAAHQLIPRKLPLKN